MTKNIYKSELTTMHMSFSRREFLKLGLLANAGLLFGSKGDSYGLDPKVGKSPGKEVVLKFAMITDVHYGNRTCLENCGPENPNYQATLRHLQENALRLTRGIEYINQAGVDFTVCLGDVLDSDFPGVDNDATFSQKVNRVLGDAEDISNVLGSLDQELHYVLGNHDLYVLEGEQCLDALGLSTRQWNPERGQSYSFDRNGIHFVVLDANFKQDDSPNHGRAYTNYLETYIPRRGLEWLADDISETRDDTIIFVHQPIYAEGGYEVAAIQNREDVREQLERVSNGRIRAVFQGHIHTSQANNVGGIPYVSLPAVTQQHNVRKVPLSVVSVYTDGSMAVEGIDMHSHYEL